MSDPVLIALIAQAGAVVLALLSQGRKISRIAEQTENAHQGTEYPNMRDELTAVREGVADVAAGQVRLEDGQRRHDSEIGGIRHVQRQEADRHARMEDRLEGRDAEQRRQHTALAKRLDDHLNAQDGASPP